MTPPFGSFDVSMRTNVYASHSEGCFNFSLRPNIHADPGYRTDARSKSVDDYPIVYRRLLCGEDGDVSKCPIRGKSEETLDPQTLVRIGRNWGVHVSYEPKR